MQKIIYFIFSFFILLFAFISINNYEIYGNDLFETKLGHTYRSNITNFKILVSNIGEEDKVFLNILNGENEGTHEMLPHSTNDVFHLSFSGDLQGVEYTYELHQNGDVHENLLDPYSYALNETLDASLVVNFSSHRPDDWDNFSYNKVAQDRHFYYGVHVEHFTSHSSWGGSEDKKGKFDGVVETNTKFENKATGFDYLKSMPFSHIELMPIYEAGSETFSMGEKPMAPFSIAKRYSSKQDEFASINEFKNMVLKLNQNKKDVIMRTNFSYLQESLCQNINKFSPESLVQGECLLDVENSFSQKLILDFYKFYASQYNIAGFNIIDLERYSVDFFNHLSDSLESINEEIIIYTNLENTQFESNISLKNKDDLDYPITLASDNIGKVLFGDLKEANHFGLLTNKRSKEKIETLKHILNATSNHPDLDYSKLIYFEDEEKFLRNNTGEFLNILGDINNLALGDIIRLENNTLSSSEKEQKMNMMFLSLFLSGGRSYIFSGNEFLNSNIVASSDHENIDDKVCSSGFCYSNNIFESENINFFLDWEYRAENDNITSNISRILNLSNHRLFGFFGDIDYSKNNITFSGEDNLLIIEKNHGSVRVGAIEKRKIILNFENTNKILDVDDQRDWTIILRDGNSDFQGKTLDVSSYGYFLLQSKKEASIGPGTSLIIVALILIGVYFVNVFAIKRIINKQGVANIRGAKKYQFFLGEKVVDEKQVQKKEKKKRKQKRKSK